MPGAVIDVLGGEALGTAVGGGKKLGDDVIMHRGTLGMLVPAL